MELKCTPGIPPGKASALLIELYGIEMQHGTREGARGGLLIELYGIEIVYFETASVALINF